MKLEVGDYVRTKNNGVCKLYREFHEDSVVMGICVFHEIDGFFIDKEEINYIEKDDILKSSKNIIDLIEVGDYVNGYKIDYINLNCETPFLRSNQPYRVDNTLYRTLIEKGKNYNQPLHFYNEDIKSIVTKEQFESMAYEVEE